MIDYQIILEEAAFAGKQVKITTIDRGIISGSFICVDEFDTDPDRLGYCIQTGKNTTVTVFIDEITAIEIVANAAIA